MKSLDAIIEQQSSPDEETRRRAVISLLSYPVEQVKERFFFAMGDSSWRVRKEAVECISAAACSDLFMEDLVGLLAANDNAGLRNSAVEAFGRIGRRAIPILSRAFKRGADQDVRKFIIDIIGDIGAVEALSLLVEALDDPDQNVCAAAIENLGKIGDVTAIPHLIKCLGKPDVMLRFTVLEAMVKIGRPLPVEVLLPLAKDPFLKKAVFDCFGVTGDAEAIPVLLHGLGENRAIRESAAGALVKIHAKLPAEKATELVGNRLSELKGSPAVAGLIESLSFADRPVRDDIITILGMIGDERAAPELLAVCTDSRLSRQCLNAFGAMGEAAGKFLIAAFPTASEQERRFIAYACGEVPIADCAEILWQGMKDSDQALRASCAMAAGKSGQALLVDELAALVDDEVPEVREAAVRSLSYLAESARDTLLKLAQSLAVSALPEKRRNAAMIFAVLHEMEKLSILVKDEDVTVRKAAVLAFSEAEKSSCVNHLVLALVDEDPDVRIAAAKSLGEVGGDEVVDLLILVLTDEDQWVKAEALKSLGKIGNKDALDSIIKMIGAPQAPVVIAALESMVAIGCENSVDLLKKALGNNDEEIVKAAIEMLSQISDSWFTEYHDKLLHHPRWDVRRSFIKAMAIVMGKKALPNFREALKTETDHLVRRQLAEIVESMQ